MIEANSELKIYTDIVVVMLLDYQTCKQGAVSIFAVNFKTNFKLKGEVRPNEEE